MRQLGARFANIRWQTPCGSHFSGPKKNEKIVYLMSSPVASAQKHASARTQRSPDGLRRHRHRDRHSSCKGCGLQCGKDYWLQRHRQPSGAADARARGGTFYKHIRGKCRDSLHRQAPCRRHLCCRRRSYVGRVRCAPEETARQQGLSIAGRRCCLKRLPILKKMKTAFYDRCPFKSRSA